MRRYRVLIRFGVICSVAVLLMLGGLLSKQSLIIIIPQVVLAVISVFLAVWGIKQLVKGMKSTLIRKPGKGQFFGRAGLPILVLAVFVVFTLLGFQIGTVRWLTAAETPGVHCGDIGVEGYQPTHLPVTVPDIILERGTVITVTSSSNVFDAVGTSVPGLLANPGPDGISLREALEFTNRDPGVYTIRFADHLVDATIDIEDQLPPLLGGNVIINGDITGDGRSNITIDGAFFAISSSGNTLHALTIQNNIKGVQFTPFSSTNTTFANNVVSNLQIRDIDGKGISLSPGRGEPVSMTGNQWINTLIIGNKIEASEGGIIVELHFSAGNRVEKTQIINNTIRTEGAEHGFGIHLSAGYWAGSDDNKIVDTLIANNTIEHGSSTHSVSVRVTAGNGGASRNIVNGVRIVGNRIIMARPGDLGTINAGIQLINGDSNTTLQDPTYRPITYPDDNIIRNVWIEDNIIEGWGRIGIDIKSGCGGARYNTVKDIFVLGNLLDIDSPGDPPTGISITAGSLDVLGGQSGMRVTSPNEVSDITIQWNTIHLGSPSRLLVPWSGVRGGVTIHHAVNNAATGLLVSHNDIAGGGIIGIGDKGMLGMGLIGVTGTMDIMLDTALKTLGGIDDLEVECNRVVGSSTLIVNLQYLAITVAVAGLLARRLGKRKA